MMRGCGGDFLTFFLPWILWTSLHSMRTDTGLRLFSWLICLPVTIVYGSFFPVADWEVSPQPRPVERRPLSGSACTLGNAPLTFLVGRRFHVPEP